MEGGSNRDSEEKDGASSSRNGSNRGEATIRIKTLDDREVHIAVNLDAPVLSIRDEIHQKLGVAVENQRIIFQGRVLNWNSTLRSYGIQDGYTIHIVDRPAPSARENIPSSSSSSSRPTANDRPFSSTPSIERLSQALSELRQTGSLGNGGPRNRTVEQLSGSFAEEPHSAGVRWLVFIEENDFTRRRDEIERAVRNVISSLTYLDANLKSQFIIGWENNALHIHFPQARPHIASPAFERLSFVEMGVNQLRLFLDIVTEENGLVQELRRLVSQMRIDAIFDTYSQSQQAEAANRMRRLVVRLETLNTDLSMSRPTAAEWERFRRSTPSERHARLERVNTTNQNPTYVMRHAIDSDLIAVSRAFREQRRRLNEIEDVLEEILECRLLSYVQMSMQSPEDYRNLAISIFFTYMQRMRHHTSHLSHILSDIEVPFERSHGPIRLVPQYNTELLTIPRSHTGTLILTFQRPSNRETSNAVQVSQIFPAPRLRTDVARLQPGEWPHLTFYPTGMMQEQHSIMMEIRQETDGRTGENDLAPEEPVNPDETVRSMPGGGASSSNRMPRSTASLGDNSLATDTAGDAQNSNPVWQSRMQNLRRALNAINERLTGRSAQQTSDSPSQPAGDQSAQPTASNSRVDTRGPETETLAPFPERATPTELRNISRNIASRYRNEALTRIAQNITRIFNEQVPPWDTRIDQLSTGTLREILVIVLELLTSSGRNIDESREMMLSLVRDEDVLIRSITESMKSMFLQGEFPTHLNRLILPRQETVGQRTDYESRDGSDSDEYDNMLVRVPSDVSQPQSGNLRLLAMERAERRRIAEARVHRQQQRNLASALRSLYSLTSPLGHGTRSLNTTGPSLNPEDMAEIALGQLPLGQRTVLQPSLLPGRNTNNDRGQMDIGDPGVHVVISAGFPDSQQEAGASNSMPFSGFGLLDGAATGASSENRQMISLDPFLSCQSRHLNFNRSMRIRTPGPNADRLTDSSQDPNPEFSEFVQAQSVPPYQQETSVQEADFLYDVRRRESGELLFVDGAEGRTQLQQVLRTAIRSLFGYMIEMDTIVLLNADLGSTIPLTTRTNVFDIFSRQFPANGSIPIPFADEMGGLSHILSPLTRRGGANETRPANTSQQDPPVARMATRNFSHAPQSDQSQINVAENPSIETTSNTGRDTVSNPRFLERLHAMEPLEEFNHGIFGILMNINRVFEEVDYPQLLEYISAVGVIRNHHAAIRQYIVDAHMEGNSSTRTRAELYRMASGLVSSTERFNNFIQSISPNQPLSIDRHQVTYQMSWALQVTEMEAIRELLNLCSQNIDCQLFAEEFLRIMIQLLHRFYGIFQVYCPDEISSVRDFLLARIPRYVHGSNHYNQQNIRYWEILFDMLESSIDENNVRDTLEFLDIQYALYPTATVAPLGNGVRPRTESASPASEGGTSGSDGSPANQEGQSSAKRRKCEEEDMDVDVGEEAREDMVMDEGRSDGMKKGKEGENKK